MTAMVRGDARWLARVKTLKELIDGYEVRASHAWALGLTHYALQCVLSSLASARKELRELERMPPPIFTGSGGDEPPGGGAA